MKASAREANRGASICAERGTQGYEEHAKMRAVVGVIELGGRSFPSPVE